MYSQQHLHMYRTRMSVDFSYIYKNALKLKNPRHKVYIQKTHTIHVKNINISKYKMLTIKHIYIW